MTDVNVRASGYRWLMSKAGGRGSDLELDVRQLDDGDAVEVFCDADSGWKAGRFTISSAGEALVVFHDDRVEFEAALQAGLRRLPSRGAGQELPPSDRYLRLSRG